MEKKYYDHSKIEEKWKGRWQAEKLYEVDPQKAADKFYCLDMFPYPSGEGLHVGHWRGYVLSDFYARYWRLMGKTVLHPMGFDAFGLPAENAAIKDKTHPSNYTSKAVANFSSQLKQMGAAYDWTKAVNTSDPGYYKWTQWFFLQLFKHGLAEKRTGLVNWCPNDQTVLANEQVIDGKCDRCGHTVTKKELSQWYFKTTEFAEELLKGLDSVEWSERVKTLQRNWIGKSDGAYITFKAGDSEIKVFTTRPDTLFGVTALVLAPEHPLINSLVTADKKKAVDEYLANVRSKTNIDRQAQSENEKTAVFSGAYAFHPITKEKLPIWIADYVLIEYGTGAVMSVPAHDERDFMFAQTHSLPIKQVVAQPFLQTTEPGKYRHDEPTITADGIITLVKHWSEDKYIGLKWRDVAWGTLLTGGVDEGMTPEETVIKEIKEETGYLHAKIIKRLAVADGLFYHVPKKTNKQVHGHIFLVELVDGEQEEISSEETAKHDIKWLTEKELASFLTPDTHKYALKILQDGYKPYEDDGSLVDSGEFTGQSNIEAAPLIVKAAKGEAATTYRLRDWLVSRQRYWGAPIPVIYDPAGTAHPVKEEHLPLELPTDVDFLPGGESPLAKSAEYKDRAEKLYGKGWHFDTDTLDTFVDSSWYYLRYLTPNDESQAFDQDLVKKWMPVDLYIGGIEHATLHLLYARFVTRFLARYGYIDHNVTEPFKKLFNIGMITMHGAKMSKSKGNTVSPDPLIEHYGTDALRGYELFVGPMDIEAEWNVNGINGIHRFLIKLSQLSEVVSNETDPVQSKRFDRYLVAIEPMIKDFRLNTYLSEAMKLVNDLGKSVSKDVLAKLLITLSPIFPYLSEEMWSVLGEKTSIFHAKWPQAAVIEEQAKELSIRVNHKHVGALEVSGTESEDEISQQVAKSELSSRINDLNINRTIYKPGLFIDFVTE